MWNCEVQNVKLSPEYKAVNVNVIKYRFYWTNIEWIFRHLSVLWIPFDWAVCFNFYNCMNACSNSNNKHIKANKSNGKDGYHFFHQYHVIIVFLSAHQLQKRSMPDTIWLPCTSLFLKAIPIATDTPIFHFLILPLRHSMFLFLVQNLFDCSLYGNSFF